MEKVSCTDGVKYEALLYRIKNTRNVLHTIKHRKDSILRRNCLLKHNIERKKVGKIEEKIKGTGEDQKEDVSSYCMTLRKSEYTVI